MKVAIVSLVRGLVRQGVCWVFVRGRPLDSLPVFSIHFVQSLSLNEMTRSSSALFEEKKWGARSHACRSNI